MTAGEGNQMIENRKTMEITMEEGQTLLSISSAFILPEKIGGDLTYSVADRSIAGDEVRKLYRELRSRSPILQAKERRVCFGPADAWQEIKGQQAGYKLVDNTRVVSISKDEEIVSAIVWCLLISIHPASPACLPASTQEDILWPIAERIKRSRILRETMGLDVGKALPKRWKADDEYEKPKEEKALS